MPQGVIQTLQRSDLVTPKILIEGSELSHTYSVMNIVVEKEINRIPTARIILLDGAPSEQDWELSNQALFLPGKEIEIKAGYQSNVDTIFKGIVIKHSLKIRASQSFLIVECKDKAVRLTIGRKSKYFYDSKDSDILEEIIGTYSLGKDVESTTVQHKELVQYNVSDWDFCVVRAQANGKVLVVDDGIISVKKPDASLSEVVTVTYGTTILDFDAEMDARNQFQKVTSYGWNAADQELLKMEASDPAVSSNGNVSYDDLAAVIGLSNLELKNGAAAHDVALQAWADAKTLFN